MLRQHTKQNVKRIKNHGGVAKWYGHRLITGTSGVRISPSLPKYGNSAVGQRVCLGRTRSPVRVRPPIPNKTFEKDRTMKKFKKIIGLVLAVSIISCFSGCGDNKVINGKEYETYGLFNKDEVRSDCVEYDLIIGNAILGILFSGTVIAPIYFYGFSLYEPIKAISGCK